jgi:hypothetical protein
VKILNPKRKRRFVFIAFVVCKIDNPYENMIADEFLTPFLDLVACSYLKFGL